MSAPLLVFADDWGRHPSSCQHLIRQLLDRRAVHWVNTIGTRRPALNLATLRRAGEKVGHWLRPRRKEGTERTSPLASESANPRVHNPRMWPWFGSGFSRGLNRRLLARQLGPLIRELPEPPIAITTLPLVADLIGVLPVCRWVYYCVDDFSVWPGLDGTTLLRMEADLVRRADRFLAVSEVLREKLAEAGKDSLLLTHGVDLPFWSGEPGADAPGSPERLRDLPRPLIVFWGVVDQRMDLEFLNALARDLDEGTIVLVGPEAEPDPALSSLPRCVRLGPVSFGELPAIAQQAGVLIMPYRDLPVTRAMQPLKLKEYLGTGRPAVVRDLPANLAWADCMDLAPTPEAFSELVRRRLRTGLPEEQARARQRLEKESWSAKARAFEDWIA